MFDRRALLLSGLAAATTPLLGAARKPGPFVDGMSFLPDDPQDLARSGLKAFICDVSLGETDTDANGYKFYHRKFELCDRSISQASARIAKDFAGLKVALTGKDVDAPGQAAIFQFQGCEPIGRDLSRIGYFRDKSLRILQLTHNESNAFATAYTEERSGRGLSDLGREGVSEMNRVRLIPDVSHASEATALETISRSSRPVILSHGACRALLPHPRAATDKMIRAVADSGGVFGVFMMSFWLTTDAVPTPEHYVAHIRHAVNLAGLDAVAVANDYAMSGLKGPTGQPFDNAKDMGAYVPWWRGNRERGVPGFGPDPSHAVIPQLNVIDRMQLIHAALLRGGFKPREADKIVGGNWLRFFRSNLV
ncbi:MAG: membrane dipeptidase [Caulobacter sp.]